MKSKLGRGLEAIIPGLSEKILSNNNKNITELPINKIEINKFQPRQKFDKNSLQELAESIRQNGIIQPIIVIKNKHNDNYLLIAGERRYRAAILNKMGKIPVIIKEFPEDKILEITLIENIQRENLNIIEEAKAYKILIEKYNLTQEKVANKIQKSRTYITNILRILNLSENIQNLILKNKINFASARTLLSIKNKELREQLAQKIMNENLSVKNLENIIKNLSNKSNNHQTTKQENINFLNEIYKKFSINKNKISLQINNKKKYSGILKIKFNSEKELNEIIEKINVSHETSNYKNQ